MRDVRIRRAMAGVLGGVDSIVFTGGIGENCPRAGRDATSALRFAGFEIAGFANASGNNDRDIAVPGSRVRVLVVQAREDLAILKDVLRLRHAELPFSAANDTERHREVPAVRAAITRRENEGGAPP